MTCHEDYKDDYDEDDNSSYAMEYDADGHITELSVKIYFRNGITKRPVTTLTYRVMAT